MTLTRLNIWNSVIFIWTIIYTVLSLKQCKAYEVPFPHVLDQLQKSENISCLFDNQDNIQCEFRNKLGNINLSSNMYPSAQVPKLPPITDIGSFAVNISHNCQQFFCQRDIYLYWQEIPKSFQIGENFHYEIVLAEIDNFETALQPTKITNNYAVYKGLDQYMEYEFRIYSANAQGRSPYYSKIFVPSEIDNDWIAYSFSHTYSYNKKHEYCFNFLKTKFPGRDFTISWCDEIFPEKNPLFRCKGNRNWVHVSNNVCFYNNINRNFIKDHAFAVSVNKQNFSTGMKWIIL